MTFVQYFRKFAKKFSNCQSEHNEELCAPVILSVAKNLYK